MSHEEMGRDGMARIDRVGANRPSSGAGTRPRVDGSLGVLAACMIGVAASSSDAALLQYTMTWDSVSGSYGSQNFSNQELTITFLYDSTNVNNVGGDYEAIFVNGRGAGGEPIRVTLGSGGSILDNAALDDVAANDAALMATAGSTTNRIFFGALNTANTEYQYDRGRLTFSNSSVPDIASMLTTDWNATTTTNGAVISGGFASGAYPLTIGGDVLALDLTSSNGSWGSITPTAVPGAGVAGLATVGVVGASRRRRR